MINLPNRFKGNNLTYKIIPEKPIIFSKLYVDQELDQRIIQQVDESTEFFITFSDMESSINETESINYTEVIIKIPIIYNNNIFLFPVISFVSDASSLIRGSYLGFKKQLDFFYEKNRKFIKFNYHEEIIFLSKLEQYNKEIQYNDLLNYPFLLHRNSNLYSPTNCLCTLSISEYTSFKKIGIKYPNQYVGRILGEKIYSDECYISEDKFILENLIVLEKNKEMY